MGKQVVGAAVKRAGGDNVVTRFGDGLDGIGDSSHARSHGQPGNTTFERCYTLFQHVLCRVHDPCVDIAGYLQVKQVGAVLGVVECVRGGLVNGHCSGTGGWLTAVAAMHGNGFRVMFFGRIIHGNTPAVIGR